MRSLRPLLLFGLAALGSCTSATEGKRPTTITIAPTALSFDAIADIQALTATVLDQDGNVMASALPGWSTTAAAVVQVNPFGVASATGNGTAKVRATMGTAIAEIDVTVDQTPTTFSYAASGSGDGLNATRGVNVSVRPGVGILDGNGFGIAGEAVTFAVLTGGGSIGAAGATTDANGEARVVSWTLGPNLGANTLQASYGAFTPVVFTVTGVEDPCTPIGAAPIALGETKNGTLATTDCLALDLKRYDLYKLVLTAPGGVVINMDGFSPLDAWLTLFASDNTTILAENDDIDLGVIQDSRIGIALAAGTYFIRATSFDPGETGSYSIAVVAAAIGVPATVAVNGGNGQVAAPGNAVAIPPSVVVRDAIGTPLANVAVDFATVTGVGSVTGASVVTNINGVATVGSWTLAAGANVLSATVTGAGITGNPLILSASGSASTAGFNVSLRFATMPTATQLAAFSTAALRWEAIIASDLTNIPLNAPAGSCSTGPAINETIDDLIIFVLLGPIDGVGSVLGSAGPCFVRNTPPAPGLLGLPVVGVMRFDTADLPSLEADGKLGAVILHEMGHVLGIGTRWGTFLQNPSLPSSPGVNTHFNGPNAIAGFNAIGGATWTGSTTPLATSRVPVENSQGGDGTRDSHWRESVLANELMTGFVNTGANPLSELTIRSLIDLGYTVNAGQADPFFLALAIRDANTPIGPTLELKDDILRLPIREVGPSTAVPRKKPRK